MKEKIFIGIDVGGTKIAAALVTREGQVLNRKKIPTPRKSSHKEILEQIIKLIQDVLSEEGYSISHVIGIGLGIPGIVDTANGRILAAPNVNLAGFHLGVEIQNKFQAKVFLGNDVNLGILGEKWLGAGQGVDNLVGVFPGTGIGGGVVVQGQLLTGFRGAAAELGHMVIDINGPVCTCRNHGCLEAYVSRWAIERDIRKAIKNGQKSKLLELSGGKLHVIKSGMLAAALKAKDPLVTSVMAKASEILGMGCISFRHMFDPEIMILGGGLIEACGDFMIPIVKKAVDKDPFFSKMGKCELVRSELEDDAVILGAVALVIRNLGMKLVVSRSSFRIQFLRPNSVKVDDKIYSKDFYIRADGRIKKRSKKLIKGNGKSPLKIDVPELEKICKIKPKNLFIGSSQPAQIHITVNARKYLKDRMIASHILPTKEALRLYQDSESRRSLLVSFK